MNKHGRSPGPHRHWVVGRLPSVSYWPIHHGRRSSSVVFSLRDITGARKGYSQGRVDHILG
jgi:hypothetical protein